MLRPVAWSVLAASVLASVVLFSVLSSSSAPERSVFIDWSGHGIVARSQEGTFSMGRPLCVALASDVPFLVEGLMMNVTWTPVHKAVTSLSFYGNAHPIATDLPASPASVLIDLESGIGSSDRGQHTAQLAISSVRTNGSFTFAQPVALTLRGTASAPVSVEVIGCWRSD